MVLALVMTSRSGLFSLGLCLAELLGRLGSEQLSELLQRPGPALELVTGRRIGGTIVLSPPG